MKKIFFPLFLTICNLINAQNLIIKESLFNEPNSSIINGYFKNGFKVVLKSLNSVQQGQVVEMSMAGDSIKLLDSFYYHQGVGFVFFEQNSNIFYERIAENKNNNKVYLIRRNLSMNTVDSILIKQTNHYGVYYSKIKKYNDSTVVQLQYVDSINANMSFQVNDFILVKNNIITHTFTKPTWSFLSSAFADFYLMNNKIFITCNYSAYKLALYVHDLITTSVDSTEYNFYKPVNNILSPAFKFNYTKINQKLYMINAYCTSMTNNYDSVVLIDIGNGTSLNKINTYAANGDYSFISNAVKQDYYITGQPTKNAVINKIETGLNLLPVLVFNKSINNKLLEHHYFFENADTQYVCGLRYDSSMMYGIMEKIYHSKTGIQNQRTESIPVYVYPNPTQQFFNINLPDQPAQIIATNVLGQQTNLSLTSRGYDVSLLVKGLYFISFTFDNKLYDVKICVNK